MVTDLGAANHYTLEHLQSEKIWAHAKKAEVFYVGGYHLTVSPDAAITLGKEAAERNVPFVFGMGAPFIAQFFTEPLNKVWAYCDYTFGNETEATAWAEAHGLPNKTTSSEDIKAIAKTMALFEPKTNSKRGRTCVITQGTEPTVVAVADGKGGVDIKEFPVHVIGKEEIVDTTGAGDAFAGGFLAGLVESKDLATCVDMGMWLAAKSLKELGPSYVDFPFFPFLSFLLFFVFRRSLRRPWLRSLSCFDASHGSKKRKKKIWETRFFTIYLDAIRLQHQQRQRQQSSCFKNSNYLLTTSSS
jgi:adenosine kinase